MNILEVDSKTGKKVLVPKKTSEAHKTFRMKMGFNDGSDRMRQVPGTTDRGLNTYSQKPWKMLS